MRALNYLVILILFFSCCMADPAALYFDPGMTHGVYGVNRYPTEKEEWLFDLHISPFYQHASGARDRFGKKVPIGDRLGRWDMFPLFWGNTAAMPNPLTSANFSTLYTLSKQITQLGIDESSTALDLDYDGDYSVPVTYEKIGIRGELDIAMKSGFGFTLKSGFVNYRQTPTFIDKSTTTVNDDYSLGTFLQSTLMTQTTRETLFAEFDLDVNEYQTVAFEDTFAQLYWSHPFEFNDEDENHVVTFSPYVGVGVWIPTGKKKDQDKAFSIPTGHDGFWGVSLEGALNFDFPETVLINVGGCVTFFETKTLKDQRIPNHKYQRGIYPWKADIKKRFGTSWNVNLSLQGKNIMDNLTVFFDYIYSKHEKDTITIEECDASKSSAFYPKLVEEESLWKSQVIQLGFDYYITPNLAFGFCGQTHISGVRVYKTHTAMGTITFTF